MRSAVFFPMPSISVSSSSLAETIALMLLKCWSSFLAATGPMFDMADITYSCCSFSD